MDSFTNALGEVGVAVLGGLGATVSAGLAIAGVIMGGLMLWKVFKRIVADNESAGPGGGYGADYDKY